MNWGMVGHEWAVDLLRKHIVQGLTRHAYLFSGPQGVGRRTLALRLTMALNCLQAPSAGEFCGMCRACVQTDREEHPDLKIVQAELQGGTLKVEQIRELQRSLALTPYEAKYRVALLLRFEEANLNAMNALLKTLEEPAPGVVMVLTVESAENLLATIVSRCEVLRLRPLPVDQVSQGLQERFGLTNQEARRLAHISGGRPGFAMRLHQEPERLEKRLAWLDAHSRLLAASRVERFAFSESLVKDSEDRREALLVWLALWRDVLLRSMEATTPVINIDQIEQVESLAENFGSTVAHNMVVSLERTINLLERNINPRLAFENLMLVIPKEKP